MYIFTSMSRKATKISLSSDDREVLNRWLRSGKAEQRLVLRGSIVLMAADGKSTGEIARELGIRPTTVSRWRIRFARDGIQGLQDAPRSGKPKSYGIEIERKILAKANQPPGPGEESWTGKLLAEALGDVSEHQVWRVLRRRGVKLSRQRNWQVKTDQQFVAKTADIIGMYLSPPENAIVIGVGEGKKGRSETHGDLKVADRRSVRDYVPTGSLRPVSSLYEALAIATRQTLSKRALKGRRRRFHDFLDGIAEENPGRRIHVVCNTFRTHKPVRDKWLRQHRNVRIHYMSSYETWLSQIEIWFCIFMQSAVKGEEFHSEKQLCEAIAQFNAAYTKSSQAFEWQKRDG